jgi:hypothetical protein
VRARCPSWRDSSCIHDQAASCALPCSPFAIDAHPCGTKAIGMQVPASSGGAGDDACGNLSPTRLALRLPRLLPLPVATRRPARQPRSSEALGLGGTVRAQSADGFMPRPSRFYPIVSSSRGAPIIASRPAAPRNQHVARSTDSYPGRGGPARGTEQVFRSCGNCVWPCGDRGRLSPPVDVRRTDTTGAYLESGAVQGASDDPTTGFLRRMQRRRPTAWHVRSAPQSPARAAASAQEEQLSPTRDETQHGGDGELQRGDVQRAEGMVSAARVRSRGGGGGTQDAVQRRHRGGACRAPSIHACGTHAFCGACRNATFPGPPVGGPHSLSAGCIPSSTAFCPTQERKEERRERLALAATSVGGLEAGWMTRATGIQRLIAGLDKYKLENPGKTTALINYIIIFGSLLGMWPTPPPLAVCTERI